MPPKQKEKSVLTINQNHQPTQNFMSECSVFILNSGIENARLKIFKSQIEKYGGTNQDSLNEKTSHLVVEDSMEAERMCRILEISLPPEKMHIVKSSWLSVCFKEKTRVDESCHLLNVSSFANKEKMGISSNISEADLDAAKSTNNMLSETNCSTNGTSFGPHKRLKLAQSDDVDVNPDSDYSPSDDETSEGFPGTSSDMCASESSPLKHKLPTGNWVCAQSSKNLKPNFNKHITDKLEEMVKAYESTNDKWRVFGYQKAIQALKKFPKPIESWKEAKDLPNVGERLADKIMEIAESGNLRKLNEFKNDEEVKVLELFNNVWGAGAHTSRMWYQQGFRTLNDLRTKANLTSQQKIGLKHYDDILDRMPNCEAGEIEAVVRQAAEELLPGVIAQACGSYRRKKVTCGDVDVLLTHPDGKSHKGLFPKLLAKLHETGFLTDDLVSSEENGNQKKYLGVCKLPGENRRHRRLDIICVPYDEYACALVYFTGSAHFNRSLRHLAKKSGMSLSEHSLNTGVVRKGAEKIYEGTPLYTPTEESVFQKLGVPYRPPEERDH